MYGASSSSKGFSSASRFICIKFICCALLFPVIYKWKCHRQRSVLYLPWISFSRLILFVCFVNYHKELFAYMRLIHYNIITKEASQPEKDITSHIWKIRNIQHQRDLPFCGTHKKEKQPFYLVTPCYFCCHYPGAYMWLEMASGMEYPPILLCRKPEPPDAL